MPRAPIRFLLLFGLLIGLWLLLSGVYKPRLVITGIICCLVVAWVIDRAKLLDGESLPLELLPRGFAYWLWLLFEIVKSAINVTRIIWHPRLPISPTMIVFKVKQKTDIGLATHGNSITLTPGTITTGISAANDTIEVHAIESSGALDCVDSEMDKRVSVFEEPLVRKQP